MKMIYKKLFFVMLIVFVANLFAAPIMNLPVLLSQPDGITINAFRSGDELHCCSKKELKDNQIVDKLSYMSFLDWRMK